MAHTGAQLGGGPRPCTIGRGFGRAQGIRLREDRHMKVRNALGLSMAMGAMFACAAKSDGSSFTVTVGGAGHPGASATSAATGAGGDFGVGVTSSTTTIM